MPNKYGFPRKYRLNKKKEIDSVFRKGKFYSSGLLKFKVLDHDDGYCHFVISISKKVGTSPERNRLKRLIREALRLSSSFHRGSMNCGIFVTRPPRYKPTLAQMQKSIEQFFRALSK